MWSALSPSAATGSWCRPGSRTSSNFLPLGQGRADHADPCQSARRGFGRPCGRPGGSRGQSRGHPAGDRPPALRRPPGAGLRRLIARHAKKAVSFTQVSALGADAGSESAYARSKAEGEAGLLRERPDAVILRPSLMFGPGDSFFNRFAALARMLPVVPLRRRRDPVPADLCRRRGRGDRAGGRRHCPGRPGLRTRRARDPHHARDDGLRLRGHRAQARHRAVAQQSRPGHGQRARHSRPADPRA